MYHAHLDIRSKVQGSKLPRWSSLSRISTLNSNTSVASCNETVKPNCLRTLYKFNNYTASASSTNRLGIASYAGDWASNADLQTFFTQYRPEAQGSNFTVILVNGGMYNESEPGDEATLDVQVSKQRTNIAKISVLISTLPSMQHH